MPPKSKGTTTWAVFEKCQKCFMNHKKIKTYEDTSVNCHISFSHAWWVSFCSLQVLNPKKKGRKKKYVNSGTVRVNGLPVKRSPPLIYFHNDFHYLSSLSLSLSLGNTLSFKVESEYTFVDFIRGGWVALKSPWINYAGDADVLGREQLE